MAEGWIEQGQANAESAAEVMSTTDSFRETRHGFMSRGDEETFVEKQKEALDDMAAFIKRFEV